MPFIQPGEGFGSLSDFDIQKYIGFFDYSDLATKTTPLTILAGVSEEITNDALGPETNTAHPPTGITSLWNANTNRFDFTELNIGDMLDIRIDLATTTVSPNQQFTVTADFAIGGVSPFSVIVGQGAPKNAGIANTIRYLGFYIGSADVRDNPGSLSVISDGNATMVVNGWYCRIIRRSL